MKALRFSKTGDLAQLKMIDDLQIPQPGPGEVLVQVNCAGLNPSDVKNVLGRFPYTTFPRTPGRDFAGTVVAGPEHWLGQPVWGTGRSLGFTRDGSHAEFLVLPENGLIKMPAALTFAQAAACGVPYTTAWDALERAEVEQGTRILVIGAAGAVGQAAIGLAKARGANVLAAVRKTEQCQALNESGITAILLGDAKSLTTQVQQHFEHGAEVIFDTTGFWLEASINALATFGRIAVIAAPADGFVHTPILNLYRRGGSIVGINSLLYDVDACASMLEAIGALFDRRLLPLPQTPETVSFVDSIEAYQRVNAGHSSKMVFAMSAG